MATIPTPASLQYQQDHINDTQVPALLASNILCLCLASIAVGLRFLCRHISRIQYQWDDWFIVAGLTISSAVIVCQFIGIKYGADRHTVYKTSATTSIKGFTQTLLAVEVIYQAATFCIKASILYLYHRIFFVSKRFTWILLGVGIFVFLYSSIQGLGALIQCVPLNSEWDPHVKRHCFPIDVSVTIFAVCNVTTDFVILILPMPLLWGLQQPLEQKIKLMCMFSLGGFVCFASIYRAIIIHNLTQIDPSWTDIPSQIWTAIKMGLGVISVCLPTYRPLFSMVIPKFRSKIASVSSDAHARPEIEEVSNPSAILTRDEEEEVGGRGKVAGRARPSQLRAFDHIGILGGGFEREGGGGCAGMGGKM